MADEQERGEKGAMMMLGCGIELFKTRRFGCCMVDGGNGGVFFYS